MDAGEQGIPVAHPMQRRVRENGVELALEREVVAVYNPCVDAACLRGGDHVWRGIHGDHRCPCFDDLFGQHAIAAAEIEDPLAHRRGQQFEDWQAERRDKTGGFRVALGGPVLPGDLRDAHAATRCAWR
jgi:hypothetical protein